MVKLFRRWWKYTTAKLTGRFEDSADPKVQLEQAIADSQEQHRRLTEQAANVIANQKQTQMRLDRAQDDLTKVTGNARQALVLTDQAGSAGDAKKSADYQQAAEAFANRMIALEQEVDSLKSLLYEATKNADNAKAAVAQNSAALQKKLHERQRLLSQLDQAKMQEQMNRAMSELSLNVGEDVPTFEQIRTKIEARAAKAQGLAELTTSSVENRMLEVEQAQINAEAQARLSVLRTQLGLPAPDRPAGEIEAPAPIELPASTETAQTGEQQSQPG
jgi:phage shock protein A